MPRIPLTWLAQHVTLPEGVGALQVATELSRVGLEEEAIFGAQVTGPLVVGRVLDLVKEPQKNGKTSTGAASTSAPSTTRPPTTRRTRSPARSARAAASSAARTTSSRATW
jgi:hypothetical protein